MGAEISALAQEDMDEDQKDLRGGLTQAALDGLMVEEPSPSREDSPIASALRKKKRSRVSAVGAGADNMIRVATETLLQTSSEVPIKSPRKSRLQQRENMESQAAMSPRRARISDKLTPATPPRQGQRSTPLSPLQPVNDLA